LTSHYEERLQKDLAWIQDLVSIIAANIEDATSSAVKALLARDQDLAGEVIVGDYLVNRQTRELDRLCHAFVARHLPSAGHLRYVSSVLRLNIALERIGDYATTVARTVASLSTEAPPVVQRDIQMMCEHARHTLHDALRSFAERDASLAATTLNSARQFAHHFDKVFDDLVKEGDQHTRPANDLFALMATFNRLERVIHQAKNICEETIFVDSGRTKGEKTFQLLFVDERNNGISQLAEHFTRKAFPQSGNYRSAGWDVAEDVDPAYAEFAGRVGLDLSTAWPAPLATLREQLTDYQFVIGLHPETRQRLGRVPFHTTVLVWDLGDVSSPEAAYRALTPLIRTFLERLRGEQAC
jgi:phosphate transport system protein